MLAAVSGATGFIGSAVVRKLLAAGRPVRALMEPGAPTRNLDALDAQGLRPDKPGYAPEPRATNGASLERVTVDVLDHDGMRRALEGCSVYYHLAAIYRVWNPDPRPIFRVNLEGTTTALLAAQAANVGRVVYTSSIAAVGLPGTGVPADETSEWNLQDIADEYVLTKHLSERIAMRFAKVMPIVVVNPAFPFGPGDIAPTPTGKIILALLRGEMPGTGPGGFCAVDVDDVAAGHVAAETRGRVGERYILGNHNVSFADFARLVCEVAGAPAPRLYIPGPVGRYVAGGMELWSDLVTHTEPKGTYRGIAYLQRLPYFSAEKARRELDFPCTPLRTSIERAVQWFRDQGMA
jgi:dihydroflavonol-4-reductase